jgi:outer membrane protein
LEDFVSKTASFWIAAATVAVFAAPASAQQSSAQPSTEHVRALIEQALAQTQSPVPQDQPVQGTPPEGPRVDLRVDEAVQRALERNLDLQVARLNPRLWDFTIAATLATYRPTLTSTFLTQSATTLPNSQLQALGSSRTNDDSLQWNSGVVQGLPWGGGNVSMQFTNTRLDSTNPAQTRNPSYTTNVFATYTQPLLRNFKIDANRLTLLTTRISQQIEDVNLRAAIVNTDANVRNAYWDLVFAVENVEAARRSLELATKLVQDNRSRVEIGTMAPIDVVQAQAEEATRRQALVSAENTRRTAELALKRQIVAGTDDDLWRATINPVDRPSPVAESIDLEAAVANALQNRTDLDVARRTLEQNNIALKSLRNLTLPALDLISSYRLSGRGGTETLRNGLGGPIVRQIPGGYIDALRSISSFDAPTWSFQLNMTYPIGLSAADANLARSRVLVEQTQAQIKQAELQVATDVTTAAVDVRNALESVQAATASRELSERRLEAVQSKFEVGMSTNYEVVQAQRDLADARTSELRALLNYRKALVEFQRSQVTGSARTPTSIR